VTLADGLAGPPARPAQDAAVASAGAGEVEAVLWWTSWPAWWAGRARGPLHRRRGPRRGPEPGWVTAASWRPARRRRREPWRPAGRRGSRCSTSSGIGPSAARPARRPAGPDPRPETEQVVEVALGEARRVRRLRPGKGLVASTPERERCDCAGAGGRARCRGDGGDLGHRHQCGRAQGGGANLERAWPPPRPLTDRCLPWRWSRGAGWPRCRPAAGSRRPGGVESALT